MLIHLPLPLVTLLDPRVQGLQQVPALPPPSIPAAPQVEAQVMLLLEALQLDQVHHQVRAQALHQVVLRVPPLVLPPV